MVDRRVKACKCKIQKGKKDAARHKYETAEAWYRIHAKQESEAHPDLGIGHCPLPKDYDFEDPAEYRRALQMREEHITRYHRRYAQLDEVRKRNNEALRARYADLKTTEEGREKLAEKMTRDEMNKKARFAAPLAPGMRRCDVGPHDAPEADFFFDPVDLLDEFSHDTKRGRCYHAMCRKHFLKTRMAAARREGHSFDVSDNLVQILFSYDARCYHCGIGPPDGQSLSLSRVDKTSKSWTDDTTFASCNLCNFSRGCMSVESFHNACRNVITFQTDGRAATTRIPYMIGDRPYERGRSFNALLRGAHSKNLTVELSKEDHDRLRFLPCYLCGMKGEDDVPNGIDRKDNSQGYTHNNAFPCCSTCNFMKQTETHDEFLARCRRIVQHTSAGPSSSI